MIPLLKLEVSNHSFMIHRPIRPECPSTGSISAEHGIGQLKREALERSKPALVYEMMRRLKSFFDANTIMNPGKIFKSLGENDPLR